MVLDSFSHISCVAILAATEEINVFVVLWVGTLGILLSAGIVRSFNDQGVDPWGTPGAGALALILWLGDQQWFYP